MHISHFYMFFFKLVWKYSSRTSFLKRYTFTYKNKRNASEIMSLSILCITLSGVWWFPSGDDLFTLFVYSLSPYGLDPQTPKSQEASLWTQDFVPLGAIALFASSNPEYHEGVNKMVAKANLVYQDFLTSGEGKGFTGQVQSDLLSALFILPDLGRGQGLYWTGIVRFTYM